MLRVMVFVLLLSGMVAIWSGWHEVIFHNEFDRLAAATHDRWLMVAGIALWFVAAVLSRNRMSPAPLKITSPRPFSPFFLVSLAGAALLILVSLSGTSDYRQQVMMFSGGIFLFVVGTLHPHDFLRIQQRIKNSWKIHKWEWGMVFFLTLLAFGVRIFRVESTYPLLISDESAFLHRVHAISTDKTFFIGKPIFLTGFYLSQYPTMLVVRLLGNTLFAARLLHVIMGSLAIPGVYLMVRRIVNREAAVLACLFLISQPLHVHFSRIAIITVFDPTLGIFAVLLLWDGLERGGCWKFALAGVLVGIAQYFYVAALLWLVLIPAWLLLSQPRAAWRHRIGLCTGAASVFLVMLPIVVFSIQSEEWDMLSYPSEASRGRGSLMNVFDVSPRQFISESLLPAVQAYVDESDQTFHYSEPGERSAINLRLSFLVFSMGIVYALRHALNPGMLFVLLWIGLMTLIGGAMTHSSPAYTRYTTAMLPLSMLVGMGVYWFSSQWSELFPGAYRSFGQMGVALLLILPAVGQNLYFIHVTHPEYNRNHMAESRWRGDVLVTATLKMVDKGRVYWLVNNDTWDMRYEEGYYYFRGKVDIVEVFLDETPLTQRWLASLDTTQDIYIFVPPVPGDAPYGSILPARENLYWTIKAAYPSAMPTMFDTRFLPTTLDVHTYPMIHIPKGAEYVRPGGDVV